MPSCGAVCSHAFCEQIRRRRRLAAVIDFKMKLSEISETLRDIRVSPVKSLGQNFLHDRNLARWVVERAELTPEDYVVEIGPGLGALTEPALAKGVRVLAIEKDARLVHFLRQKFPDNRLEVLHGDALKFDVRTLYAQRCVKLLGNLPYYISSQLLMKFLAYPSPISFSLLMLQKEMARRLSAVPSTADYGALSLQLQLHHRVEFLRTVPAAVFVPRPEVDSALVAVTPRDPRELPYCDYEAFEKLVRLGFSQRRKQLRKLVAQAIPSWNEAAAALNLNPKARAEELSLQQWIALTNRASPIPSGQPTSPEDEELPVVDQTDHILRHAPRSEVHGNNLVHRAVHVFVFNGHGELYLQKRSRTKDRHPLLWDSSAAGHVGAGEEYDAAARREVSEELGIDLPLKEIARLPASERTGQEFIRLYYGHYNGQVRLNRQEIEYGNFFPAAVVSSWAAARPEEFAPGFRECWQAWQRKRSANRSPVRS
jgi:16S rRNA (adenine1518-N6/adenine1519-N6)-dimethyltransferase